MANRVGGPGGSSRVAAVPPASVTAKDWHAYGYTKGIVGTFSGFRTQRMYPAGCGANTAANYHVANLAITPNQHYALPIIIPAGGCTLSKINWCGFGSNLNHACVSIYENLSDGDFYPGARLYTSGVINTAFSGLGAENRIACNLKLANQLVWVTLNFTKVSGTPQIFTIQSNNAYALGGINSNQLSVFSYDADSGQVYGWIIPETFSGNMASVMPSGVGETPMVFIAGGSSTQTTMPAIYYELAP